MEGKISLNKQPIKFEIQCDFAIFNVSKTRFGVSKQFISLFEL